MKKLFLLTVLSVGILKLSAQQITPAQTTEQCPGVNITFSVTIAAQSIQGVQAKALNIPPLVVQQPFNSSSAGGNITFNFIGRFADANNKQTFTVSYTNSSGQAANWDATFTKIKSLQTANSFSQISPTPVSITAQRCQTQNFTISFSNVQYGNPYETPPISYGTVTNYEYLLPQGWSLNGGSPSNGSSWLPGTNSVTVTSDLSHGDGSFIRIRPVNTQCATSLIAGQEVTVSISRPEPALSVTQTPAILCSGTANYTISGMPSGSTVLWTINNTSDASLTNTTSPTVTLTRTSTVNTVVTLTATVSHCSYTYTRTVKVALGTGYNTVNYTMMNVTCEGRRAYFYANVEEVMGATNYAWYAKDMSSSSNPFVLKESGSGYNHIDFPLGGGNRYYTVYVLVTTPCGDIQSNLGDGYFYAPSCMDGGNRMAVSPNPAKDKVTIQLLSDKEQLKSSKTLQSVEVQVSNSVGNILLKQKATVQQEQISLDVSRLKQGMFIIRVWDGTSWRLGRFIKQ